MVEFRTDDLPKAIKSKPPRLGDCPHGVPVVAGKEVFTDFPQLYWSFRKECGRDSSSKSREIDVSVKVSLFWGFVQGTVDYGHRTSSSRSNNSLTIQCICRIEKGLRGLGNAKPVKGSHCTRDNCRYGPYYADAVFIGAEASLTVSMDTKRGSEDTSNKVGGGVKIFAANLGDTINKYASSFKGNFTMNASFSSSIDDTWTLKPTSMTDQEIQKFITDVQKMEEMLVTFPERVTQLDNSTALHCKYIFKPVARLSSGPSLDGLGLKLETKVRIESVLQELLEVKEAAARLEGNASVQVFVRDVRSKIETLEKLRKYDDVSAEHVKNVYGDHALNFYKRELKRITKNL